MLEKPGFEAWPPDLTAKGVLVWLMICICKHYYEMFMRLAGLRFARESHTAFPTSWADPASRIHAGICVDVLYQWWISEVKFEAAATGRSVSSVIIHRRSQSLLTGIDHVARIGDVSTDGLACRRSRDLSFFQRTSWRRGCKREQTSQEQRAHKQHGGW